MSKKRAASGAVIGLALTASGVFAASNPNPVSVLAQDHSAVGGPNDNHGGAVSAVARGTHGQSAIHGKSAGHSQSAAHRSTH